MTDVIKELKQMNLSERQEDLDKYPHYRLYIECQRLLEHLQKDDENLAQAMNDKLQPLNDKLKTGLYDEMLIKRDYEDIIDIHKKIEWVYIKSIGYVEETLVKADSMIKEYYLPKKEHNRLIEETKKVASSIDEENKKLKKQIEGLMTEIERLRIQKEKIPEIIVPEPPKVEEEEDEIEEFEGDEEDKEVDKENEDFDEFEEEAKKINHLNSAPKNFKPLKLSDLEDFKKDEYPKKKGRPKKK